MRDQTAPLILIVEDNPPLRRMLGVTLRSAGYQVVDAGSGRDAIAIARREPPALALQDLMLPDMEAPELLRELRALPGNADLPVLALSGSQEKLDTLGNVATLLDPHDRFTELLLKPVEPNRLLQIVERHAPNRRPDERLGTGRQVLLVDDDPVQRKITRIHFERAGFGVIDAAGGLEALEALRTCVPDVIVSDVLMPRLDGFELTHAIRADPALRSVPVILTSSAYLEREDRDLARRAGAYALIERRPDLAELLDMIGRSLNGDRVAVDPTLDFPVAHARRIRAQLDRQAEENRELQHGASRTAIELSVLAGISTVVTRASGTVDLTSEVLSRCLETGGMAAGVILLVATDGGLREVARAGDAASILHLRRHVAGCADADLLAGGTHRPITTSTGEAVLTASLNPARGPAGVLAFAWDDGDLNESRETFTRAIAAQLSEALSLELAFAELEASREETISRLAIAAELRDGLTARHTERVSAYAALLAERYGLEESHVKLIRLASVMHDVGKIGISDSILLKPGKLSQEEFVTMQAHTMIGERILGGSQIELLQMAATIARTHHERYDGTGYPSRLAGNEIPIEGRIVAVADVFDALTSDRIYRPAMSVEETIDLMVAQRGRHFDPELIDILLESLDEIVSLGEMERAAA